MPGASRSASSPTQAAISCGFNVVGSRSPNAVTAWAMLLRWVSLVAGATSIRLFLQCMAATLSVTAAGGCSVSAGRSGIRIAAISPEIHLARASASPFVRKAPP